ncbi:acyl-CoA thioesterase II [Ponticaulis sp.]|uniref:acyl-CoA thioesterase II n=1 Tax=Ponticaulis sp. TaxID=2020902 RepID=UPI000B70C0AE|nr:acyl-CoA thioesterase II [Ponticaulis sp.]MAI89473.1 acyl-CoA thioesterase II [Ponticaulis sp.]OUY00510.1 MAG: acyl-CoA thioesterase II [Hyphomonadaceae bacterium TMED5]
MTEPTNASEAVDELIGILDLERIEVDRFRGFTPDSRSIRVFGGQVISQALVAAYRTVEDRSCHSLHAYFIRPGNPEIPILYEVDRARDGNSFTTRRVVAIQNGEQIFNLAASFHVAEEGFEHQTDMPDIPQPEDLEPDQEMRVRLTKSLPENIAKVFRVEPPLEIRSVNPQNIVDPQVLEPLNYSWIRLRKPIEGEPRLHQAVLAYASDMSLLDTSVRPHGVNFFKGSQMASLDHAMWFHDDFRADDWLLYVQKSPKASQGRGMNFGRIYRRDGLLVATVAQEGLIRPFKKKPKT